MNAQGSTTQEAGRVEARASRALVVEDDPSLCRTLVNALQPWSAETRSAGTVKEARRQLLEFRPELLVVDFMLPDGNATELLASVRGAVPLPAVVALSACAAPRDSFELAELGARAYLQKPVELGALEEAIEKALIRPPALDVSARQAVGRIGLKEAEEALRRTMVAEALDRAGGNRRGAARLLEVSRELLQHVIRKLRS
jgi:two-component system, response regulator RegA